MENLSQRDIRWKDIKIGNSSSTIGALFFGIVCFPFRFVPNISTIFRTKNIRTLSFLGIKKKFLSAIFTNSLSTILTIMKIIVRGVKLFLTNTTRCSSGFISYLKKVVFFFTSTKKFKIFNSIIGLISINVMNTLGTFKFSTQKLFHNISVFKKSLTMNLKEYISIFSQRLSSFPSMVFRTIMPSNFCLNFGSAENGLTKTTSRAIFSLKSSISTDFKNLSATLTSYIK